MAGVAASELSRGGMRTKLDAGKIATAAGTAMIVTSGDRRHPLAAIEAGERATFFQPSDIPVKGYKSWIAGQLEPAGRLRVDAGAVAALLSGKSLLAAGVRAVEGDFARGETVAIVGENGREVARGLVAYDAPDAVKIMGLKSAEIAVALGYETRGAMVHRDDLVVSARVEPARKEKAEG
jgi:glutamate 5-kinase